MYFLFLPQALCYKPISSSQQYHRNYETGTRQNSCLRIESKVGVERPECKADYRMKSKQG